MELSNERRKLIGGIWAGIGLIVLLIGAVSMWSAQGEVRDATPYPATLISVSEPECSGTKSKTCRFEAVARIKSPSATIEQPASAGRYSSRHDANSARAAHVVGAPTTVYQLSSLRGGYLYYTAPAFAQLREDSTIFGNLAAFIFAAVALCFGLINLALGFIGAARERAIQRKLDAL